ncbi:MAG TPA: hypothetical protein VGP02_01180 [Mycobacteriales bacterium]|nr:hypothetical protein [Mycobacteriales bacterium]
MTSRPLRRLAVPAWSVLLAVAALGPALGPGHVLTYDMVSTPHPPLGWRAAGLGDALPRAVPQDLVVALLGQVVPGSLIQAVALVGALVGAAWGAALLVPTRRTGLRLAAASLYGWNTFVAERLFLGHWGILLAYAALPWVVRAALAVRAGRAGPQRVVLAAIPAALTPTGTVLVLAVAAAVLLTPRAPLRTSLRTALRGRARAHRGSPDQRGGRPGRRWGLAGRQAALVGTAALTLPWVVAGLVSPASAQSDPAGVDVFSVRAEGPGGLLATLAGLGGIWNGAVTPPSRASVVAPIAAVLVVALSLAGARVLSGRWAAGGARGLAVAAAGLALVAAAGAVPGLDAVLRALVVSLPGAGLLRDGHKFLAPLALLFAVAAPLGVERAVVLLRRRLPGAGVRLTSAALVGAAVVLPVATLPDLAWGGLGRLDAVRYPAEWDAVAERVAGSDGALVTLPFAAFRSYGWNGGRTSLDPADRYLDVPVVVDDTLVVAGADGSRIAVAGEDPRAAAVRRALRAGAPLVTADVRWALVQRDQPGTVPAGALDGMRPVWTGPSLSLYEAVEPVPPVAAPSWPRVLAVALAHLGLLATLVTSICFSVTTWRRTRW